MGSRTRKAWHEKCFALEDARLALRTFILCEARRALQTGDLKRHFQAHDASAHLAARVLPVNAPTIPVAPLHDLVEVQEARQDAKAILYATQREAWQHRGLHAAHAHAAAQAAPLLEPSPTRAAQAAALRKRKGPVTIPDVDPEDQVMHVPDNRGLYVDRGGHSPGDVLTPKQRRDALLAHGWRPTKT